MANLFDKLSEEKKKEIAEYIHRKWKEASQSSLRKQVLQDMKDSRDAYAQIPTSQELWTDAINLVLPLHSISVDQLEPRLVASIVAHDEIIKVDDLGELDEDLSADIEQMDNAVLKDDVKIVSEVKKHIHDILLDGHVYVAPYWDFREGKVRSFVPDEGTGLPMQVPEDGTVPEGMIPFAGKLMQEQTVKVSDQAKLAMLDTEKVFFPDRIEDWEEAPVVYEYFMTWGDYKSKVKRAVQGWVTMDTEELEDMEDKLYTVRPDEHTDRLEGQDQEKGESNIEAEKLKNEMRCLQGHITYDIDDDGVEEKLVCTIEEQTKRIVYLMDNAELDPLNRKQIRVLRLLPKSGTGYGHSIYSKLRMIQEGGSNALNILLNACIIQMIPFCYYEEAAGFKSADIEIFPGAHIPVGDTSKILMNQFSPNAGAFKDVIEIFFRLWQYIIVLPDYNMGIDPKPSGSTATGTLALLQEASISHDYWGSILHDQYAEIFRIIHDLCYLNMDPAREIDTLGHPISQRVLSDSYKLRLVATSKSANRHVERMEMQDALAVAEKGVQAGVVVPDEPVRDYLETFRGLNVDKWMNGPIAKVCARMREQSEQGADPFGPLVMQMLQMTPEEIQQMLRTIQVGTMVRDDVTELTGGQPGDEGGGSV